MDFNLTLDYSFDDQPSVFYPSPPDHTAKSFVVVTCLMITLIMSIAGNASTIVWQHYGQNWYSKQKNSFTPNLLLLNINLICMVQFGVSLTLPAVLVDYLLDYWIFNSALCTSHFVLLNLGRTATAWLIVLTFLNQILQEKSLRIEEKRKRLINNCFYWSILIFGVLFLMPTLSHIQLTEMAAQTDGNIQFLVKKCLMTFNNSQNRFLVNIVTFVFDFLVPLIMVLSLSAVLRHYKQKSQQLITPSDNRVQNLLIITVAIFLFCNLPHWFAVCWVLFADIFSQAFNLEMHSSSANLIADFAQICVYIQPAILWFPLGKISKTLIINLGSQDFLDLTVNSTSVLPISRSRVFSNTSECHSLPGNLAETANKDPLKPTLSLTPLDSDKLSIKKIPKSNIRKPNFKEIKSTNRINKQQERILRLDTN